MHDDKKQERKKALEALTRQGIYDAVINLLIRDGIQGLTMERVAAEAGVAKGTLYVYFESKEKLLETAVDASFDPLQGELAFLLEGDGTPYGKLREFSLCNLRFFDERRDLLRVLFYDRERIRSNRNHYADRRYRSIVQRLADVLDEGVINGQFVSMDSRKVAAMFVEANIGVIMQRIVDGISGDVEKDAKQVIDVFVGGLRRKN
jgi:AcrR family transcriptional regulator